MSVLVRHLPVPAGVQIRGMGGEVGWEPGREEKDCRTFICSMEGFATSKRATMALAHPRQHKNN
jgi:hypothetical protein